MLGQLQGEGRATEGEEAVRRQEVEATRWPCHHGGAGGFQAAKRSCCGGAPVLIPIEIHEVLLVYELHQQHVAWACVGYA